MFIKKLNQISFGKLPFHKINDRVVFNDFLCKDRDKNDCFVKSENNYLDDFQEIVRIYDSKNIPLAENELHYYKAIQQLYNSDMNTLEKINYKKGYGTIMHLCSIMELLENNYPLIKLSSLSKAVYFHSKMKFTPDIQNSNETILHLKNEIINNAPNELKSFSKRAENILSNKTLTDKEIIIQGNHLIYEYIQAIRKGGFDREKHNFKGGFTMILTKENILKNKEFFNKLFKDFHIDYLIK